MSGKIAISITNGKNDTDRATFGFMIANTAIASGQETVVFLNIDGAYLAKVGYADDIYEEGLAPLKGLIDQFIEAGGKIWVCGTCFKKRNLTPDMLINGATIIGSAKFIEFIASGATCLSY